MENLLPVRQSQPYFKTFLLTSSPYLFLLYSLRPPSPQTSSQTSSPLLGDRLLDLEQKHPLSRRSFCVDQSQEAIPLL